jgi:hypothetical protein
VRPHFWIAVRAACRSWIDGGWINSLDRGGSNHEPRCTTTTRRDTVHHPLSNLGVDTWSEKGRDGCESTLRALIRFSCPNKRDTPPPMIAYLGVPSPSNGRPTGPLDTAPSCEPTNKIPPSSTSASKVGLDQIGCTRECECHSAVHDFFRDPMRATKKGPRVAGQSCPSVGPTTFTR